MCSKKNSLVLSAFVTMRTYPNRVASENDKEAISFSVAKWHEDLLISLTAFLYTDSLLT